MVVQDNVVRFDSNSNEPYISDSFIKADDMGRASLFNENDKINHNGKDNIPYSLEQKQELLLA